MEINDLKNEVRAWSGFELTGSSKDELKESLRQIKYDLECEIFFFYKKFRSIIDDLKE